MKILSIWDLLIPPIYIGLILMFSSFIRDKHIRENQAYKYYVSGIGIKIIGAISICLVYTLYYGGGGDSTGYFEQGRSIYNLLYKDPNYFFEVLFQGCTAENYSYLDETTTYVDYHSWTADYNAMYISRLVAPLFLITFNSFI